jgi:3-deoxy-D-manno-octulosonic-acid transferase
VGEALTAEPVVHRLRAAGGQPCIVHSYSSPSAARWPDVLGAAHADYVPADTPEDTGRTLDALRPTLLAFSRGDIWPELAIQAAAREIPTVVIGAIVRPGSLRLSDPVRSLYASALAGVSWIGAASEEDGDRWRRAGAPEDVIEVSGDPRHDQVIERVTDLRIIAPLQPWASQGPVLVAGSVEPSDEGPLLRAAAMVLDEVPTARLLLVPHDPSAVALARLEGRARRAGIAPEAWSPADTAPAPATCCVMVAGSGALYHLYALGSIAYVGGGFRRGKLHAVVEPAAYALPILTGPHVAAAADGRRMAAMGGLAPAHRSDPEGCIADVWLGWLKNEDRRVGAGLAARRSLAEGAAERTAEKLRRLL